MKKLYSLTLCGLLLLAAPSFAQTGGTYTAILPGDWHVTSGPGIWQGSEPPTSCPNCVITLNVTGGGTINLNRHVVLTDNSKLIVGGAGNTTILNIGNSGATDSSNANGIVLFNDNTNSTINVNGSSSVVVAANTGHAGDYDGIFTSYLSLMGGDEIFTKQVGFAPQGFDNNTIENLGSPGTNTLTGGQSLSSTGVLPIVLSEFGATLNEGVVDLNWSTSMEINSDHFAILRSSNAGAGWDEIGKVPAHGMSSTALQYSFIDNKPVQGTAEYRLQMVDKDGKYAYSEVKTVRLGVISSVSVYPNPARDFVNVTLGNTSGFTLIRLYNQGGQLLQEKNVNNSGGATIPLSVSSYPEGNYIVVVTGSDGSRQSSKVLIAK